MLPIATIFALALAAQAAPTERTASSSFSIPAIHTTNHVRNGTAAMLKAYKKFHLQPSAEQQLSDAFRNELSLSRKRQDGSVTASPEPTDVEYLVPVTVGGQTLNLDVDTASSDLWVFSSLLPAVVRSGHAYYNSSNSSTYKAKSGYTWSIDYKLNGWGASGIVGTDTVTVGQTTVIGQVIELAKNVSSGFIFDGSDGVLGLSFSSINTVQPKQASTFFDNAQDSLDSPIFAAYLPKNTDGAYNFGYTDDTKYTGTIVYTDVDDSNGLWEYPSTEYKVGSTSGSMSGYTGITDTGTTLILMGTSAVNAYYQQVSGATISEIDGGYIFPCSTTLPDLSFLIGSTNYATVPGTLLNFCPADQNGMCFGGVQDVGSGSQNIYGDVFLNANYGVFDASGPRFGFAPSTGPTS